MTAANTFVLNNKWERDIAGITEREWMNYFSVIKLIKEVKLKDFQYKVTNKILVTKSFLYRINKIDNDRCEYCHQHPETIRHLFIECERVKHFWTLLKEWLRLNSNISLDLEEKNILFAYQDKNQLRNFILVLAKYYIYANKFSGKQLNLDVFKAKLRKKFQGERYTAHIRNNMGQFMRKWSQLYHILIT